MRVEELIKYLQEQDPKAKVVIGYETGGLARLGISLKASGPNEYGELQLEVDG